MATSPAELHQVAAGSLPRHAAPAIVPASPLLLEIAQHMRRNRAELRGAWARQVAEAELLATVSWSGLQAEVSSVYDGYADALEVGTPPAFEAYAQGLSERFVAQGAKIHEVIGLIFLLSDILARSLMGSYGGDLEKLGHLLDACEPAASRIVRVVAQGLVQEQDRVIQEQQEAIRDLLEAAASHHAGAFGGSPSWQPLHLASPAGQ